LTQDVLDTSATTPNQSCYNVSAVGTHGGTGVEFRYYSKEEYAKLTPEQRQSLYDLRKKQGGKGKGKSGSHKGGKEKGGGSDSKGKSQLKTLKRRIAALKSKISKTQDKDKSDASSDEEVPMKSPAKKSNANNPALTRQS
jgi:ribosomal protein L29